MGLNDMSRDQAVRVNVLKSLECSFYSDPCMVSSECLARQPNMFYIGMDVHSLLQLDL